MQALLDKIRGRRQYVRLVDKLQAGSVVAGLGLPRAARLPVLALLHQDLNRPTLLITDRVDHALSLFDELGFWVKTPRYFFAEPNPLFYEAAAWGASVRKQRLQALTALVVYDGRLKADPAAAPIIVASGRALMTRTLPPGDFLENCQTLEARERISLDALVRGRMQAGYQRVNTVLEPGQLAHRGGLLDIWPVNQSLPVRLDFFGEEIETMRRFDPANQRTIENIDSIFTTPAREYIISGSPGSAELEQPTEFHIPLLHEAAGSLLDYLPPKSLILVDDVSLVESMAGEVEEQAVKFRQESVQEGALPANFPVPYVTWSELDDAMQSHAALELGHSTEDVQADRADDAQLGSCFTHDERFGGRLKPFIEHLGGLVDQSEQVVVVSRQATRLEELWREQRQEAEPANPIFTEASLSEGFALLEDEVTSTHLITDAEVFGWARPQPRAHQKEAAETPESVYADLNSGDFVVHIDHGLGRFAGLTSRELDGHEREFLAVEYDAGGVLYVPVHQADRLTRYVGPDAAAPSMDRLGGQAWSETTKRVKEAVQQVAQELLDLYARRQIAQGHAFQADTAWQSELEDSFPYSETEDQKRAVQEIKHDMEAPRPMDRLLCGDVGYGKTEVALRAAFKAVMGGRQAAILVPTTVLAQQHYETFLQRLAAFPVTVEMLSRFRTPREQNEILLGLAAGGIDIVIGTHRLISSDVQFQNLGLVIIDEEQRFGVTHKEHLKKLRTEVDVLTLTATPIPRTLYMALTGVRDISNLNTPPEERLSIINHVGPYSARLVRQATLRELERGGQIFFVHNRVQTIGAMRAHLEKLIPEARIGIGHGQMAEQELADVMHRFTRGEIDILLSTSIIESGLDIPNANTLIVDRADTFGLAQLYQLRGRVGRGAARAYAYFFRHRKFSPTMEGQQRLEVIAEATQLGSGYSIAMRDLEIRGAGELLGTRQHGHIAAVGFHLYTRMLADGVRRLRREAGSRVPAPALNAEFASLSQPLSMPVNVDLPLPIGIPEDYIGDQELRLRLYRRIADLRDEAEVEALAGEFTDRFGSPPEMVRNLFYQMRVKLRAEKAGLAGVNWENGQVVLRYPASENGRAAKQLPDLGPDVRGGKSAYWCSIGKDTAWPGRLLDILLRLPIRPAY